jgi:hypothetical protein
MPLERKGKTMKALIPLALVGTLSACVLPVVTDEQRQILAEACQTGAAMYADFKAVAADGQINADKVAKVDFYYAQVARFCRSPSTATRTSILINVAATIKAVEEGLRGTSGASTASAYTGLRKLKSFERYVQ